MNIVDYVTPESISLAYDNYETLLEVLVNQEQKVNKLLEKKQALWADLLTIPDFKPGRSNLEQDAKIRAAYPDFMDELAKEQLLVEKYKLEIQIAGNQIGYIKTMINYFEVYKE